MPSLVKGQRREGNIRTRIKRDGGLTIEQDFHFRIRADSLTQDRVAILHSTPDVPVYGVPYGAYGMLLKGADAERRDDDALLWDAVYHLSNDVQEGENTDPTNGQQQTGNPTAWEAVFTLGFEDHDSVYRHSLPFGTDATIPDLPHLPGGTDPDGYSGSKWVTSAGEPYGAAFVRQYRIITRDFVQFEPITGANALTLDDIEDRNELINDRPFLGKPKRTLKLTVESCAAGFYYGFRCWRVDYRLAYNKLDWRLKQLDVGTYYLSPDRADQLKFMDKDTPPSPRLGSLDGKGGSATDQLEPAVRYHKEFEEGDLSKIVRAS